MECLNNNNDNFLKNFPQNQIMNKLIKDIYDKFLSILNNPQNEYKSIEDII